MQRRTTDEDPTSLFGEAAEADARGRRFEAALLRTRADELLSGSRALVPVARTGVDLSPELAAPSLARRRAAAAAVGGALGVVGIGTLAYGLRRGRGTMLAGAGILIAGLGLVALAGGP